VLTLVLACLVAYLLGSVPTGLIVVRRMRRIDLRQTGSGGTGATNVARQVGVAVGLFVAAIDFAKGWIAVVWIPLAWTELQQQPAPSWLWLASAIAVVVGHAWPLLAGFRGGKGVATAGGATLALSWPVFLAALAVFIVGLAISRRVSVGSLLAVLGLIPAVGLLPTVLPQDQAVIYAVTICLVVVGRHTGNLRRLLAGTESRI